MGDSLLKLFVASFLVFILNDLIWLLEPSYAVFTFLDWGIRLLIILTLLSFKEVRLAGDGRTVTSSGFTYKLKLKRFFLHVLFPILISMTLIGQMNNLSDSYAIFKLFSYPEPSHRILFFADSTIGIFLVALSETLSFVVLPILIQRKTGWPLKWVISGACLTFGLAHWSMGLINIVFTGVVNAVFFWVAFRTRSFGSVTLVHFYVDFHFLSFMPFLNGQIIGGG